VEVLTEELKVSDSDGRSAREKLRDDVEAAMDDPTQWADEPLPVPARRSEKRQRAAMISIRLSSKELETVQAEAAARGLTVSRYVRDRALEPALSESVHKAHYVVAVNRTSHTLMNVVIGEQTGSPVVPHVLGPRLRLAGVS
jgi:predicted DNA binding CopG/RHH family protein